MPNNRVRCACVNRALLDAPVYEPKVNAKNWLAIVDVDGYAPGGLSRRFLDYGRGACLYLVGQLALFDAVEFGADRYSKKSRWYGVVVAITAEAIFFEEATTGAHAVMLARQKRADPSARAEAMLRESEELEGHASKLRREAAALTDPEPAQPKTPE